MAAHDAPVRAGLEQLRHHAADGIGMRAVAREIAANRQVDRASPHFSNYRAMARMGKQMRREQRLRNGMARVPEDLANGLSVCLLAPSAQPAG
jgi:hypothetical protein